MATLKITLDKRRHYKDGRSPLILRLTMNGKSTSIHLGIKIYEQEWDQKKQTVLKKHPNHKFFNLHLKDILLQNEKKLIEINAFNSKISLVELKQLLVRNKVVDEIRFFQFAKEQIENLKVQGRYGSAQAYQTAANKIVEYGGKKLKLNDINYKLIFDFDAQLSTRHISVNGIAVYMRTIRAILNRGRKLGCYDMSNYPFDNFKIRTQKTASRAESIGRIIELSQLELENELGQYHSRNIFLLIFSLIGISYMDLVLLKKVNLKNGRIIYRRKKTGKLYSIKATTLFTEILNLYKNETSDYLLPQFGLDKIDESRIRQQVNLGLKSTNYYLKKLGKKLNLDRPLTTYVARHSWSNIAKDKGFSKDLIAEALGHNYGNSITGIYLDDYGNEVIDSANEQLTSLISLDKIKLHTKY